MRLRCETVVAARGGHTRYWTPQTSILHGNFCLFMICSDNDVEKFCWYCLICYAHINLNTPVVTVFSGLWRWWTRLPRSSHKYAIGEEHGCGSGSESLDKHDPRNILHCYAERRDQSWLRKSGLRARRPVVVLIIKQCHRTAISPSF
jgi:hypothetical protein